MKTKLANYLNEETDKLKAQQRENCKHQYREIETAPLGVVCIRCGNFIGAHEDESKAEYEQN